MRRLLLRASVAVSIALAFTSSSHAVPVNYSESVSGDLPQLSPLTLFTLDTGVNTISGRFTNEAGFPLDFDSLAFIVPANLYLSGGTLSLADVSGGPNAAFYGLYQGSSSYNTGTLLKMLKPNSPGSDTIPALDPGTYNISHTGISGFGTANFTVTLTVVPEPASLGVLGLASLTLLRRTRNRKH